MVLAAAGANRTEAKRRQQDEGEGHSSEDEGVLRDATDGIGVGWREKRGDVE